MEPNQKVWESHRLVLQPEPIDPLDTAKQLQPLPKSFGKVVLVRDPLGPNKVPVSEPGSDRNRVGRADPSDLIRNPRNDWKVHHLL